eukprot:171288_1
MSKAATEEAKEESEQYELRTEVTAFLCNLGLEKYVESFRHEDIETMDHLNYITREDLKDLGVSTVAHRAKIIKAIIAKTEEEKTEQSLPKSHPEQWNEEEVATWLGTVDGGELFAFNEVDGEELFAFNESVLARPQFGIKKLSHRRGVANAIQNLSISNTWNKSDDNDTHSSTLSGYITL